MSDPVWNNPLVWIAGITGLFNTIQSLINAQNIKSNHQDIKADMKTVSENVNGKMQELIDVSGDAREALGKEKERIKGES